MISKCALVLLLLLLLLTIFIQHFSDTNTGSVLPGTVAPKTHVSSVVGQPMGRGYAHHVVERSHDQHSGAKPPYYCSGVCLEHVVVVVVVIDADLLENNIC